MSEDIEKIFDEYTKNQWTDGLPIIPPTKERVERMLEFTDRKPDDSLGRCPPSENEVTIEAVAANAVMAGCKPEYFPVVVTEIWAMLDRPNLRGTLATTGFVWPVGIANGPIPREIGMHCGWGLFGTGPMHRANLTIGRTMTLVCQNVGKSIPGVSEKKPQFNIGRYGICFMENEADSPWEPLHVEKGYDINDSTVTVYDEMDLRRGYPGYRRTPPSKAIGPLFDDSLLRRVEMFAEGHQRNILTLESSFYIITPATARIWSDRGLSKADVKRFWYEHARTNIQTWFAGQSERQQEIGVGHGLAKAPLWMRDKQGRVIAGSVSIFESPESIHIVVAGPNEEGREVWVMSLHHEDHPVITKPITLANGTPAKSVYDFKKNK